MTDMQNPQNFQKQLDSIIASLDGRVPRLLLHSCCAPCSSYVLEYLSRYFEITVFYYNPNITEKEEYDKRVREIERLTAEMKTLHPVHLIEGPWEPERFFEAARGLEKVPEGGERCRKCFELRLSETAKLAREGDFDWFTTSLTISPLKNAAVLNEVGTECANRFDTVFLPSDFKKKGGYQRSIELSNEFGLYRQDYCGCVFSKRESEEKRLKRDETGL